MKGWRMLVVATAVAASLAMPRAARAEYPDEAGWGILSVVANLGYMPVKTVYAVLGGVTGGLAYVCTGGSYETASTVWSMSLGGTYALTPAMLRGEETIAFAGTPSAETSFVSEVTPPETAAQSGQGRTEEGLPAT